MGNITKNIYKKQVFQTQASQFVDELDRVLSYAKLINTKKLDEKFVLELQYGINQAWGKAFVLLPDEDFKAIHKALTSTKLIQGQHRNKAYFNLRKRLNPKTKLVFDDYMNQWITVKTPPETQG